MREKGVGNSGFANKLVVRFHNNITFAVANECCGLMLTALVNILLSMSACCGYSTIVIIEFERFLTTPDIRELIKGTPDMSLGRAM